MIDMQMLKRVAPEAGRLIRFEIWSDAPACLDRLAKALGAELPQTGKSNNAADLRLVWLEPMTWLVRAPEARGAEVLARIEAALASDGGACDISGALVRTRITGPAWRTLLTIGGGFDPEAATFGPGGMSATGFAHAPGWLAVVSLTEVEA